VKNTTMSLAAAVAIVIAGATTSFAAELPTYETKGLPISPVQASLLGATGAEQVQAAPSAVSPHQLSVLTPRHKMNTATAAPLTTAAAR
jgi:hypothetical protein